MSITGENIYRHHVETRVELYVPTEESFLIPLKYIIVTRTTNTTLDVMSEKNIEDYWNVDGARELSDTWTGFTRFIVLNERPPDGKTWSGRDLRGNKRPLDPTMYGQICGSIFLMQRNGERSKRGLSRNQSSITPEDYVVSSSLNQMMKIFKNTMKKRS